MIEEREFRIVPNPDKYGTWAVQWRKVGFFNFFWEYEVIWKEYGSYTTYGESMKFDTEEKAELKIKELMDGDVNHRKLADKKHQEQMQRDLWVRSTEPRKVPPFLHIDT